MQPKYLIAAIAATFCVGTTSVGHAESNAEVFSPGANAFAFNDGSGNSNTGSFAGMGYEVIEGHAVAEGDMVLGKVDGHGNVLTNGKRGLGQASFFDRWTNGIIPYQFSADISSAERALAEEAIEHWNAYTSISLIEITDDNRAGFENFINFETSNGCASYVGMRGGEQSLWILFHEHTRSDRDNFINVQWDNIVPGKEFNFDVLNAGAVLLGEYDYGSIMHYGEQFFSTNSNQSTISVLDGKSAIGQRLALSDRDIQSANELYSTDLALSVNSTSDVTANTINIDFQIVNQGSMGAHNLSLSIDAGGNADWVSMSPNSGWDCEAAGTKLNCTRETLETSATSVFTVVANANGANASTLKATLLAKSRENDYGNNAYNDSVDEPVGPSAGASSDTTQPGGGFNTSGGNGSTNGSGEEPGAPSEALPENPDTEQAAQGGFSGSGQNSSTVPEASGGSGGAVSPASAFVLLLLAGVTVGRRRRQ